MHRSQADDKTPHNLLFALLKLLGRVTISALYQA